MKIFKENIKSEYQEKFVQAFPENLKGDVLEVLNIIPSKSELNYSLITKDLHKIKIDNEIIKIPVRIYFQEPTQQSESNLTEIQKDILNCIYTRHHKGYVREKRLNQLSNISRKWKTPFIVQLIGEYIYELLPIIDKR